MRFSLAESMCDPSQYVPLATAAEEAGWASFAIPDSIFYAEIYGAEYPYGPGGDPSFLEDKPFIDPFALISALGAVTERLRFTTFVLKLPIRHPVLVAKSASSVAVLTGNRFGFGVGLSPWPEDFRVCGQDWDSRGRRMDEMIEIVRGLTKGGYYAFHGEHYDFDRIKISPVPTQPIPILIGGHSNAALRRAARVGDGWMHAGGDPQTLDRLLGRLAQLREEYGRSRDPFEIHVVSFGGCSVDEIRRFEDLGVTDVIVLLRDPYAPDTLALEQKIDTLRRLADEMTSKV
jgi:probable F420-dependent oxidoreductase